MFYFFLPRAEHYESREARQTSGTGPDRWKGIVCYYFYFYFFLGMLIDIYSHYYSNNVSSCYMSSVEMCPVACSVVAHFKECDGIQHLSALSSWPQHSLYGGIHLWPLWLCSSVLCGHQPHTRRRYLLFLPWLRHFAIFKTAPHWHTFTQFEFHQKSTRGSYTLLVTRSHVEESYSSHIHFWAWISLSVRM